MKTINAVTVLECSAVKCAYNINNRCHTPAITVGSACPKCETFMKDSHKAGADVNGNVGACHKDDCSFNDSLECTASGIRVGEHLFHADCVTYSKK